MDHLFVPPDDGIFVNKSNKTSILSKAKKTIEEIRNKDELLARLKKLYYRTSSYDYETLGFILECMQKLDDTEDIPLEKVIWLELPYHSTKLQTSLASATQKCFILPRSLIKYGILLLIPAKHSNRCFVGFEKQNTKQTITQKSFFCHVHTM